MHFDVTLDEVKVCNKQNPIEIQSTLALRAPRYYGHPADADKRQPLGETYEEMTETNSRYYGNSDTFLPPRATFYVFFLPL